MHSPPNFFIFFDMQNSHNALPSVIDVTGVILAGGRSTRMGRDKATLELAGQTLFERTLEVLQTVFPRVLIAGDRPDLARPGVPCVPDLYPGSALGGLQGGLAAITTPWMFVTPCDLAHPDADLVRCILRHKNGCDVVVPRTPGGFEPVFALYHKNCLPLMERMLARGQYRIYDFYNQVHVRYLDPAELPVGWERALRNLNTPQELQSFEKDLS